MKKTTGEAIFKQHSKTGVTSHHSKQGRLRLNIRRNAFMERVGKHWNWLHKEVLGSPSLEMSKEQLEEALSALL